jgi:hypothetical protein
MSTQTVCNALNALRTNEYTSLVGKSKAETNNYTINIDKLRILATGIEGLQPLESERSSHRNETVLQPSDKPSTVIPKKKKDYLDYIQEQAESPANEKALQIAEMYDRMDREFKTSFSRNKNTDIIVKFVIQQENKGDSLDRFVQWAKRDEFNASRIWEYAESPIKIKTRWQVAMSETGENFSTPQDSKFEGA